MSFKLTVRQGPRPALVFELDKDDYTIGREAGNDIVIEDPQVSRRHAQLTRQGVSYLIEDMGSTNGTYVNGKRVTAPVLLANGDLVGLADTVVLAVQAPATTISSEATLVMGEAPHAKSTVPPTLPAFTPPVQAPPASNQAAARQPGYAPPPSFAPQPAYVPPPQPYASPPSLAVANDRRRTIVIGVGCLALIMVVCMIGFVLWSFIDCRSFSSVFPFLFPPFQC